MKKSIKLVLSFVFSLFVCFIISSCTLFGSDSYTVAFNTNGGSSISSLKLEWQDEIVLPDNPTKEGYTFAGWFTDSYLTVAFNESTLVEKDLVLYAKWQVNQYTVSFETNGGSSIENISDNFNASMTIPETTKAGYHFVNWFVDENLSETFNKVVPSKDITVYAKWAPNVATIKFNGGEGATGVMTDIIVTTGYNNKLSENKFKKEGYSFECWVDDNSNTYFDEEVISLVSSNDTINLTAKWQVNKYFVNYVNDGISFRKDENLDYNSKVVLPETNPSLKGYTFVGWGVMEKTDDEVFDISKQYFTCNNGIYSRSNSVNYGTEINSEYFEVVVKNEYYVTLNGLNLYAKYTRNSYSISFHTNGGSAIDSQTKYYTSSITAPTAPTKVGYTFAGWYSDSTLKNSYLFTTMPANDLTLFAKWKVNKYTILFDSNGGSLVDSITQDYGSEIVAPENPSKEGYTFAGWNVDVPSTMPSENITLTASWTANTNTAYKVVHNKEQLNGSYSAFETDNLSGTTNTNTNGVAKEYTGFTLKDTITQININPDGSTVLNVYYTRNTYTVSFKEDSNVVASVNVLYEDSVKTIPTSLVKTGYDYILNDGEFSAATKIYEDVDVIVTYEPIEVSIRFFNFVESENPTISNIKQDYGTTVSLPTAIKEGYTFDGWYTATEGGEKCEITTMPSEALDLYARWTINQYTITFDSDGGSAVNAITQNFETTILVPNNPTKTGYVFAGWDEEIPAKMPSKNLTLTATWTVVSYNITYVLDNGVNGNNPSTYTIEDAITLNDPTKEGYTFKGWSEGNTISLGTTGDKTFTATWEINTYTLTFKYDSNTTIEYSDVTFKDSISAIESPTKRGYKFVGWFEEESTDSYVFATMPSHDLVLFAKFDPVYYSLSFINEANGNVIYSLKKSGVSDNFDENSAFLEYVTDLYNKKNAYNYLYDAIEGAVNASLISVQLDQARLSANLTGIVIYANIMTTFYNQTKEAVLSSLSIDETIYNSLDEYSQDRIKIDMAIISYMNNAIMQTASVNDLQTAIIGILANQLSSNTTYQALITYDSLNVTDKAVEIYSHLYNAFDLLYSNDLEYLQGLADFASTSDQQSFLEQLAAATSSELTINSYAYANLKANAYNPIKQNCAFDGWVVYENYDEGIARLTATWVSKMDAPKHLEQQSISKNSITVTWDEVLNASGYKVYVKRGTGDFVLEEDIAYTNSATISVAADEVIEVYVVALYKDNNGTYQQYSNLDYTNAVSLEDGSTITIERLLLDSDPSNVLKHEHTITSETNISVDTIADYYYYNKTDSEFYFFTNKTYSMPVSTTNIELKGNGTDLANAYYDEDSGLWVLSTKSAEGTFKFVVTNSDGSKEYDATINYLISSIDYGNEFSNYQNANNYLNSNKELYTIGTAKVGDTTYDYLSYNSTINHTDYYNGFHFDFDVVTDSALILDTTLFKLSYKFYGYNELTTSYVLLDDNFAIYDDVNDAFFFLEANNTYLKYKVVACAKIDDVDYTNTKIPNKYKNDENYEVSFEFKLNDGINIFNHEELAYAYRNDTSASNINIHSNITSSLSASMVGYYQYYIDVNLQYKLSGSSTGGDITTADRGELDIADYSAIMVSASDNTNHKYGPNCWVICNETEKVFKAKDGTCYKYQLDGSFAIKSCEFVSNPYKGLFKMVGGSVNSDDRSNYLDVASVYTRQDFVSDNTITNPKSALTINGNLFTIDASNIPCLQSAIDKKVGLSGHLPTYTIQSTNCAVFTCNTQNALSIKNLTIKGNTQDASSYLNQASGNVKSIADYMDYTSGGLCGVRIEPAISPENWRVNYNLDDNKGTGAHLALENVNISNTTIAIYYDFLASVDINYTHVKQTWANSVYSCGGKDVQIANSKIESSGGASIHLDDIYYSLANPYFGYTTTNPSLFVDYTESTISNNVSGEEQWFKAYGMEVTALGMKSMLETNIKAVDSHLSVLTKFTDSVTGAESEKINLIYLFRNDHIKEQEGKDVSDLFTDFNFGDTLSEIVNSSSCVSKIYHSVYANCDMVVEENISGNNAFYIITSKDVYEQCAKNIRLQVYENVKAQVLPNFGNDANTAKAYIDNAYEGEANAKAACLAYCLDNSSSVLSLSDEERAYFVNNYYYYILAANANASNNMQYVESVVDSYIRENCSKLAMSLGYTKNYLKFTQPMGDYSLQGMVEVYYKAD